MFLRRSLFTRLLCDRACDATIDGIVCPIAGCGSVMRWSQADEDSDIVWECSKSSCDGKRDHEELLERMILLEQLHTEQLRKAELYQAKDQSELLALCRDMLAQAEGFLHPHNRFLVLTHAHLAQFEPHDRKFSREHVLVRIFTKLTQWSGHLIRSNGRRNTWKQ